MNSVGHSIQFGKQQIQYSLSYSARKQLKITVFPDGLVAVDAPQGRSKDEIKRVLNKRARWIAKQRIHFEKYQPVPSPRQYISGETHRYLGKQYRLRVRQGPVKSVKLSAGFLCVMVADVRNVGRVRELVESWYRARAEEVFERRVKACHDRVKQYGVPFPVLRIRKMRTRWGSCRSRGVVTLNTELVRLPMLCIDYLIIHELCHLRVHNHSPAFYRLLDKCLPDWSARRERLNLAAVQS